MHGKLFKISTINSILGDNTFDNWMNQGPKGVESDSEFIVFTKYFILMTKLIPIGFIVNLEIIRMIQGFLLKKNDNLIDHDRNL